MNRFWRSRESSSIGSTASFIAGKTKVDMRLQMLDAEGCRNVEPRVRRNAVGSARNGAARSAVAWLALLPVSYHSADPQPFQWVNEGGRLATFSIQEVGTRAMAVTATPTAIHALENMSTKRSYRPAWR